MSMTFKFLLRQRQEPGKSSSIIREPALPGSVSISICFPAVQEVMNG